MGYRISAFKASAPGTGDSRMTWASTEDEAESTKVRWMSEGYTDFKITEEEEG